MPVGFKGRVAPPNLDHLIYLSHLRHRARLRAIATQALPSTWDSRTQLSCIPVLESTDDDQAQCGSCWDFSGTFVAEVALMKAGVLSLTQRLSKEYTLDCGKNGGCNGDDNTNVLDWAKATGLPLSSDYGPYSAGGGNPGQCRYTGSMKLYKIDDWGFADGSGGQGVTPTDAIKAAVMTYGCVGCAVAAGGDSFWDNGTGIGAGTNHNIDHDVAIVGWDDSKGRGGAWIMRNSWGPSWGTGGYAFVAYGAYDLGTEAVFAKVASVIPPQPGVVDWSAI